MNDDELNESKPEPEKRSAEITPTERRIQKRLVFE
jgi:hypothetical protein